MQAEAQVKYVIDPELSSSLRMNQYSQICAESRELIGEEMGLINVVFIQSDMRFIGTT